MTSATGWIHVEVSSKWTICWGLVASTTFIYLFILGGGVQRPPCRFAFESF